MALYVGGTSVTGSQVLDATKLSGTLPALNASSLTNLDAADLSGTLPALNASNLTNLDAADLSGTLPAIDGSNLTNLPGGGKVLQVVSTTSTSQYACSSASFVASGLSVSITPSATSSKIWISATFSGTSSFNRWGNYTLFRGSTNLGTSNTGFGAAKNISTIPQYVISLTHLDSPSTTSSTAYAVGARAPHWYWPSEPTYISYGSHSSYGSGSPRASITVFEIDGS